MNFCLFIILCMILAVGWLRFGVWGLGTSSRYTTRYRSFSFWYFGQWDHQICNLLIQFYDGTTSVLSLKTLIYLEPTLMNLFFLSSKSTLPVFEYLVRGWHQIYYALVWFCVSGAGSHFVITPWCDFATPAREADSLPPAVLRCKIWSEECKFVALPDRNIKNGKAARRKTPSELTLTPNPKPIPSNPTVISCSNNEEKKFLRVVNFGFLFLN